MASSKDQKGKAVLQEEQMEPLILKPDLSQMVVINGWGFHDPIATAKPTPAAPGTYLTRTQRRRRSKKHFEKKVAEEQRHLEAIAKLSRKEASKLPYKDLMQWWSLENDEDPIARPLKKPQVPKRFQEPEGK